MSTRGWSVSATNDLLGPPRPARLCGQEYRYVPGKPVCAHRDALQMYKCPSAGSTRLTLQRRGALHEGRSK